METLTADNTGVLKKADDSAASWKITPGKRYAFQFTADSAPAAGTVTPKQLVNPDANPVVFPATADQDNAGLTYDLTTYTGTVSGGFEFVATGTEFHLVGASVTETFALSVSLIECQ